MNEEVSALRTLQSTRLSSDATSQITRFAVAGMGVTALSALIYLALSTVGLPPLLANGISHVCGVLAGFHLHGKWTFRDDRRRDGAACLIRFAAGSSVAFLFNSLWVVLLTRTMAAPTWTAIPAMVVLTPIASFAINRWWVFQRQG